MDHITRAMELADFCFRKPEERLTFFADVLLAPALDADLTHLCREIETEHQLPEGQEKTTVVHYMSLSTLYSIVRSEVEWQSGPRDIASPSYRLYDSNHFNDPEEGTYLLRKLPDRHNWLRRLGAAVATQGAYISSFILPDGPVEKAADNLVFWRTYGDEGAGCSLSFSVVTTKLKRVHYDHDRVSKTLDVLEPVFASILPLIHRSDRIADDLREQFQGIIARQICYSLESIRYLYKSRNYAYEQECRVVRPESAEIQSHIQYAYESTGRLPYIRHYFPDSDMVIRRMLESGTTITIGPCVQNQQDVRRSMETLRTRAQLRCEVRASQIKYRRAT